MNIESNITILRWHGGEGGDTLMRMLLDSNPTFLSNNKWGHIDQSGKTMCFDPLVNENFPDLINIIKFGIGDLHNEVEVVGVQDDLEKLKLLPKNFILKSHWYKSPIFNDITIDLITSPTMLPFVVGAFIQKNTKYIKNYNQLRGKIKNPNILKSYDLYNVIQGRLFNSFEYSNNQLTVESLFDGWDSLKQKLKNFNLYLDDNYKAYYTQWVDNNQQYLPSDRYKNLIKNSNFDYTDTKLSLAERYCLLSLAKEKFTILEK